MALSDLTEVSTATIRQTVGSAKKVGTPTSVTVLSVDSSGNVTSAKGTTVPTNADAGFAKGCLFTKTDQVDGTHPIYENTGSATACTFDLLGDVSSADISAATVTGKALTGFVAGAGAITAADSILTAFNKSAARIIALEALGVGGALADGNIIVGNGAGVAASVNPSGDVDVSNAGAFSIGANKVVTAMILDGNVTNAKIADSTGVGALGIRKSATVLYDFGVVGGAQGTIVLTGSPTIPDNAVVWVESYDVLTTCTSGGADAATIALQLPTDGALTTAIAISAGSNPWDAGVFTGVSGGLITPLPKKTTGARVPSLVVAGGQDLTAGKIVFQLAYWVSQ